MTWGELSDGFQTMFPGGRWDTWKYLGEALVFFGGLQYNGEKKDVTVDFKTGKTF